LSHFQRKKSSVISDSDDDSDVRPSKLFERPHRTPSGIDADEISGLGTKDRKATFAKHRHPNSSDSDSDDADGSLKTPDCGTDNNLALLRLQSEYQILKVERDKLIQDAARMSQKEGELLMKAQVQSKDIEKLQVMDATLRRCY